MSSLKDGEGGGRGRPRGFDTDAALDAAMHLFWRKGYRATSLDDLVAATGASRASLYKLWGDKSALFVACLDLYGARFAARVDALLARALPGREAMRMLLDASADRLSGSEAPAGCLRCNSTLEVMGSEAALDAALVRANAAFLDALARLTEAAAGRGEIPPDRARPLAVFFTGVVNGMATLSCGGATREELAALIDTALAAWPAPPG